MYFLANSSDGEVDSWVALRGKLTPEIWNPHDGRSGRPRSNTLSAKRGP